MQEKELYDYLISEYQQPFSSWDFSYLTGRRESIRPQVTWDFTDLVRDAMRDADSLLDMDTGGGEFLVSLQPLPPHTAATESYLPNVPVAKQRLEPLGVHVVTPESDDYLPFPDASFDLIINRHGAFSTAEIARTLRAGSRFITQQVGGQTNARLHELLEGKPKQSDWNLAKAASQLENVGMHILEQHEAFPITRFRDVGAIVYYLKAVAWEIPDFSVEKHFDRLVAIHQMIEHDGYLDIPFHHFLIVAEKARE